MKLASVLIAFSLVLLWAPITEGQNETIVIAGMIPYLSQEHEKGFKTAVELAFDIAKNRSEFQGLFHNYKFNFQWVETYRLPTFAFTKTYQLFYGKPQKERPILVLGPPSSNTAKNVAMFAELYQFMQVSFAASSYQLLVPNSNFLNTGPTTSAFNDAIIALMKRFKWQKAAVLYDFKSEDGYFTKITDQLAEHFAESNLNLVGIEAVDMSPHTTKHNPAKALVEKLEKLKKAHVKIFIGEFNREMAWFLVCEVYHLKLFGDEFVWILHHSVRNFNLWKREPKLRNSVNCTSEQLLQVLNYTFIINIMNMRRDEDTKTASGLTVKEYLDIMNSTLAKSHKHYKGKVWDASTLAFDAMWMSAIGLNNTAAKFGKRSIVSNVKRADVIKSLKESILDVNFQGLSGPVTFRQETREREGVVLIEQFRDGSRLSRPVGQYFTNSSWLEFFNRTDASLFSGNFIPLDHWQNKTTPLRISSVTLVAFSAAASAGIVIGTIFLVFNRYYRSYKFIRLSAPMFNDIIVLGCILCLVTVYLFGIRVVEEPERVFPMLCKARAWILTIGFSLAFGAMFIKTWRIYKICTNKHLKVRIGPLSNWYLLAMVVGIVAVDLVILVTWELLDPLKLDVVNFVKQSSKKGSVTIIETLNICTANYFAVWLTIIYVYKGILLLYGVFLAYETRNVVYAHLNDSRVIGICVYNVVVLSAIGAFLDLVLDHENFRELYAAVSVCIIFPSTATICLIFIPKLIYRLKTDDLEADEMMDTTIARPSIDLSSTYVSSERKRNDNAPTAAVNDACSVENQYEEIPSPDTSAPSKVD